MSGMGHKMWDAIVVPIVITPLLRTQRDAADNLSGIAFFLVRHAGGSGDRQASVALEGIRENLGAGGPAT
jgi:hypothetical protein